MTEPRRPAPLSLRLTPEDRLRLEQDGAGMSLGAYIRWRVFDPESPPSRSRNKAPVKDHVALSQALAALGQSRIANNLNQLAHAANIGALAFPPEIDAKLREAIRHVADIRRLLIDALGLSEDGSSSLKPPSAVAQRSSAFIFLNAENEHVEVHEIRGVVASDLKGAMKEAQAVAMGIKCKQFLFTVSLSLPEKESVSVEAFEAAIDKVEETMGLTGQPRMIVFHEKEGRRHAHAVWSRIDAQTMTARQMSNFKLELRIVSKELYFEHG